MLSNFLKNISILKKFLFINLITFIVIGSFTIVYLKTIKPNLSYLDDCESNISEWKSSGGIAILHTSTNDSIRELQQLGF